MQVLILLLLTLTFNSSIFAYPPDNAAVLYYRSAYTLRMDSEISNTTNKYIKGEIEISDEIKEYIESNEYAVKQFIDAGKGDIGDIRNCGLRSGSTAILRSHGDIDPVVILGIACFVPGAVDQGVRNKSL